MTRSLWTSPPDRLVVGAHRGLGGGGPENTLDAARHAFRLGVDFVEADLRATADDVAVVLHDPTFARVAGDRRAVAEIDLATALRLKPDLPTVAAMIDVAMAHDGALLLDTKLGEPAVLARAIAPLAAWLGDGRTAFGVRSLDVARAVAAIAPAAPLVGLLAGEAELPGLVALGARWARLWQDDADRAAIARLHDLGLAVLVMAGRPSPDEVGLVAPADLAQLIDAGIDGVMLDDPGLALSLAAPRGGGTPRTP